MQALYQKQGRSRQFGSKQERDAHIGDEVKQLERAAAVKRSSADDLRAHVQQLTSQLMDLSQVRRHQHLSPSLIFRLSSSPPDLTDCIWWVGGRCVRSST